MDNLEVGSTILLKAIGNNARYGREDHIEEGTIQKVGRKLVDVSRKDFSFIIKIRIDTMCENSDYPSWRLYLSQQEIEEEKEFGSITDELRKIFGSYGQINLSLDQLRKIKDIITMK
jgi:hypothetical protein